MLGTDPRNNIFDAIDHVDELPFRPAVVADKNSWGWENYAELGETSSETGALDEEMKRPGQLAVPIEAEGDIALHSHGPRELDDEISREAWNTSRCCPSPGWDSRRRSGVELH